MMLRPAILLAALAFPGAPEGAETPKVLFFADPMQSDNDVLRRPRPEALSDAERHFAGLSKGASTSRSPRTGPRSPRAKLARYKAVVFFTAINPPGVDVDGLVAWVRDGGAFVGIHSTANTYEGHPESGAMLGARYDRRPWRTAEHPQIKVRVRVEDRAHLATRHLGESIELADDIYQFKDFDRSKVRLVLSLDPPSLDLENPKLNRRDRDLPISWAKEFGKERVFYTALGDWEETWMDPRYRTHLVEGIR